MKNEKAKEMADKLAKPGRKRRVPGARTFTISVKRGRRRRK